MFFRHLGESSSKVRLQALWDQEREKTTGLQAQLEHSRKTHIEAEKKISHLEAQKQSQAHLNEQLHLRFEKLSQDILDKKSRQFREMSSQSIKHLLDPLQQKLQSFQKQVEETYGKESRERFSLGNEIKKLCETHGQLTQALRGDVKARGRWGEIILEKILESSGLVEGNHYRLQGKGLKGRDEEGRVQKPDAIIYLPEGRHIVIDSKVSLKHYESFIADPNPPGGGQHLNAFIDSIKQQAVLLSGKQYHLLEDLKSPDFVLMFFPIEGAFSLALQNQPDIFQFCWNKKIIMVSPTTLLATLRTVESVWKIDKQNRNVNEIARQSGSLYDKLVGFVEDMEELDRCLSKARDSYNKAQNKLSTGKGNALSKLENIKKLGAKTQKHIPTTWTDSV